MARIRYIKPDFFTDTEIADLTFPARLAFAGLWCHADRDGRLEDNPNKLKVLILPYDKVDFEKILVELTRKRFIHRYTTDERQYIQIHNFSKHQKPHHTEQKSTIPPFDNRSLTVQTQEGMGNGEGNGEKYCSEPQEAVTEPPILVFPTKGKPKTWPLTKEVIRSLESGFPGIDVLAQARRALSWCQANPLKQKTGGGMGRFLYRWIEKSNNGYHQQELKKKEPVVI